MSRTSVLTEGKDRNCSFYLPFFTPDQSRRRTSMRRRGGAGSLLRRSTTALSRTKSGGKARAAPVLILSGRGPTSRRSPWGDRISRSNRISFLRTVKALGSETFRLRRRLTCDAKRQLKARGG